MRRGAAHGASRRAGGADPLAGVVRAYIDGSNLVHALARDGGPGGGRAPASALVAGIRAAFPPGVIVDLVFDGPPAGSIRGRLATGMRVAYSGRASADKVIADGVEAQLRADGPASTFGILVVTDDRGLQDAVRRLGARTAGTAWLAGRIGRAIGPPSGGASRAPGATAGPRPRAGTTLGHARPPRPPRSAADDRE